MKVTEVRVEERTEWIRNLNSGSKHSLDTEGVHRHAPGAVVEGKEKVHFN